MSKYTKIAIKVPDINRSYVKDTYKYSNPAVIAANKTLIDTIFKKFGPIVNRWGSEFEIDDSIICCFIATESNGVNSPPNAYGATGLMQMTPATVWEMYTKWEKIVGSKMSKTAIDFFNRVIPASKTFNANILPSEAVKAQISVALTTNIEFNIAAGTANIRWLLEAFKKDGLANINVVMVSYNAGYYATKNKITGTQTTEQMVNNKAFSLESRSYLLKMLGRNGFLDLWWSKK